jgi:hypothetical protein
LCIGEQMVSIGSRKTEAHVAAAFTHVLIQSNQMYKKYLELTKILFLG